MKTFFVLPVMVVVLVAFLVGGQREIPQVHAFGSGPEYSIAELWDAAEIVAVVVPSGPEAARWNNDTNTMWRAQDDSGIVPMVYRDETVRVIQLLKGHVSSDADGTQAFTIRNIGGVAGGVEYVFDGLYDMKNDSHYLVFLKSMPWPSEDGSVDLALGFVGLGQGLYQASDRGYRNSESQRLLMVEELPTR